MDFSRTEECLRKVFDEVQKQHLTGKPQTVSAAKARPVKEDF